jgi:hypothetical protein
MPSSQENRSVNKPRNRSLMGSSMVIARSSRMSERWVRSVKQECLAKLVLLGEGSLQRSLSKFTAPHSLRENRSPAPSPADPPRPRKTVCRSLRRIRRTSSRSGFDLAVDKRDGSHLPAMPPSVSTTLLAGLASCVVPSPCSYDDQNLLQVTPHYVSPGGSVPYRVPGWSAPQREMDRERRDRNRACSYFSL